MVRSKCRGGRRLQERPLPQCGTLAGYAFIPIGVKTLGGIGDECAPFLNYVLTQLNYTLRKPFHEVAAHFWQSLSVLVQRMKSNRILRCLQLLQAQEKQKKRK